MTTPDRKEIKTWTALIRAIREGQGAHKTTIGVLRDINGAGRTGDKVMDEIISRLSEYGISYLPSEMPTTQRESVILYDRGTYFGSIMRALERGVTGSSGDGLLSLIRQVNEMGDTERVVPVDRETVEDARDVLAKLQNLLGDDTGK